MQKTTRLFAAAFLLSLTHVAPVHSQVEANGVTLQEADSVQARQLLRTTLSPVSEYWSKKHLKGSHIASSAFVRIAKIAFPIDPTNINHANVDSVLTYLRAVATEHPDSGVRAEFLLEALQVAHGTGRDAEARTYYQRLRSEHTESKYAREAFEYAPERAIQVGKPVPNFDLPALESATVYRPQDFQGEVVLLDFWGPWCAPCIKEMPVLHEAYRQYHDAGFNILSIALNTTSKEIENARSKKWPMPWKHSFIADTTALDDEIREMFEIRGIPKKVLIDGNGIIIATDRNLYEDRLLQVLDGLIAE